MKKQFAIAVLTFGAIVLGTDNVQAQNHTATTTATIKLSDVISIDEGAAIGGTVDFIYDTAEKYNKAQTVGKANSLKVTSTKEFDVKVKAGGADFVNTLKTSTIPVNVLTITATGGSMKGKPTAVTLSATDQTLITKAPLGSALTLNLDYTIPADKSSSADILGKPADTYTQTVIYTVTH